MRHAIAALAAAVLAGGSAGVLAAQQPAAARNPAPRMMHAAAGRTECLSCHGPGVNDKIKSTPASHHFQNSACVLCHRPADRLPPSSVHPFSEATADCRSCHNASAPGGAKTPPASHANFHLSLCPMCHQPGQGG
jgi:hypothetical protein